jgi:hypothetical protein
MIIKEDGKSMPTTSQHSPELGLTGFSPCHSPELGLTITCFPACDCGCEWPGGIRFTIADNAVVISNPMVIKEMIFILQRFFEEIHPE